MTKKELKRLSRTKLIELLLEVTKENDLLRKQLGEAQRQLAIRAIRIRHSGSIAEAALRLNGIFEAAQAAADQYLENIRANSELGVP